MTYTPNTVIQTLIETSVPITTLGDTLYGNVSGDPARLAGNTAASRKFYTQTGDGVASAIPVWYTLTASDVGLGNVENTTLSTWVGTTNITTLGTITTGTWSGTAVGVANGGTGLTSCALGDIFYGGGTNTISKLAGVTTLTRSFLRQVGDGLASDAPAWDTVTKADVGLGSVEDVAINTWAGSTNVTTLGTISTGTWSASTIGTTKGGTGLTSYTLGDVTYASATNTLAKLSGNTSTTKKFLRQTGDGVDSAAPAWDTVTATDVGLGSVENTALSTWTGSTNITTLGTISSGTWSGSSIATTKGGTGITTYTLGDILYSSASNTLAKLPGNTTSTKKFLRQTGDGVNSATPAWDTIAASDVGLGSVENTALSTWAGTTSITTLGTISTGTWSGTSIGLTKGGTGQTTAYAALDALTVAGADIASSGTTDIAGGTGLYITITGTTTITAFGTAAAGVVRILKFSGALILTHNATSLILPTGANITTTAGDVVTMVSLGSGNWRCASYMRADGSSLSSSLADGSVTLAKMANLAQDQFIGRTTASTGVPQTATITAAARTVLDDGSVDAMLTTLGGTSYNGSGGIVRTSYAWMTEATLSSSSSSGTSIYQSTAGNKVLNFYTTTAGSSISKEHITQRVTTTDATVTTLHSFSLSANNVSYIKAVVVARRTGGSGGTAQDAACYFISGTFNITSGTAAQIGSTTVHHSAESQAGWDATFDVSGSAARIRVTGATNNNITWHSHAELYTLST